MLTCNDQDIRPSTQLDVQDACPARPRPGPLGLVSVHGIYVEELLDGREGWLLLALTYRMGAISARDGRGWMS